MALLAPKFLDCVVAIGFPISDESIRWAATGFFLGRFAGNDEEGRKQYRVFLVTNRHVFEGKNLAKVRFNPDAESPAGEYDLPLVDNEGTPLWKAHDDNEIDVCIVPIDAGKLQSEGIRVSFFNDDNQVLNLAQCNDLGVCEGDGVYVLGFPMGLVGEQRNYAIVRFGAIARIRDALHGVSKEYLVDILIFPGNSGGPAIIRPEVTAIQGTKPVNATFLIGIVSGYVPYQDVALSQQTGRPRIVFEENSGLASVHPIDYLIEIIDREFPKTEVSVQLEPEETNDQEEEGSIDK